MFRFPCTGRATAALLAVAAVSSLVACGSTSPAGEQPAPPATVADARPLAGSPVVSPPSGDRDTVTSSPTPEHDHGHGHGHGHGQHEETAETATVASSEVCDLLEPSGCALLPDRLTEAQVDLVTWAASTLAPTKEAPDVVLGAGIMACALLDDLSYRDMVVLADRLNQTEPDPSMAMVYAMTPFVTPAAVTFLCPEHTETARAEMVEVVCAAATPEVCAIFAADWLA